MASFCIFHSGKKKAILSVLCSFPVIPLELYFHVLCVMVLYSDETPGGSGVGGCGRCTQLYSFLIYVLTFQKY